jgi:hypothetical protein
MFSISCVSFITSSWKTVFSHVLGYEVDVWHVAYIMFVFLIPIAWVRNISKFSFVFLFGNILIFTTIVVVML